MRFRKGSNKESTERENEEAAERELLELVQRLVRRTTPDGQPNTHALAVNLRDTHLALWNTKVLGSELARLLHQQRLSGAPVPASPERVSLASKICNQHDIEQPWLRYWCGELKMEPIYHRKVWEDCFVMQGLWQHDMLKPGRSGLGFAVGIERLPAYFTSKGVSVLATDLAADDARSAGWQATGQHSKELESLWKDDLVEREQFESHCRFRPVDMNAIPEELHHSFDFCWSVCSFEHLGSIEKGLKFVTESLRCLKPGGVAIHTTEFNMSESDETLDDWSTVLFQRRHIEDLGLRLLADGHHMLEVDYSPGEGVLDQFVDVPPYQIDNRMGLAYPETPHLRISVDGFPATSIGLIIRAAG